MVDIDIRNKPILPFLACGMISGLALAAPGCDDGPLGDLAEQCGLTCPAEGITEGNASISGVVSIDSFFGAVITVRDAAASVSGTIRAELEGMAASLNIEGYESMTTAQLGEAIPGAIEAKFGATVDFNAGLVIDFEPAKCQADIEVAAKAAAECDVDVEPGSVEAKCMGTCEVNAEVAAQCQADGTLRCEGQAPNLQCSGSCTGDCQLEVAAMCEGTCNGTCMGSCSACTGGNCNMDMNGNVTNCAGSCDSMCEGTCELNAGGSCSGSCEGSCAYDPGGVECEANATAKCDVSGMAEASCEGKCEGNVEPPEVSAECEASVEAKAKAEVTCTPPSLSVDFQWAAGATVEARAEFKVWLEGFKVRFANMLAASAKLENVNVAVEGLLSASANVIPDAVAQIEAQGGLDLSTTIGLGCALDEADRVGAALGSATEDITGSLQATASVTGALTGG